MFDLDKWQEIFHTLKQNKLRSFLTAFGVFWGIFMLILLLGAGKGLKNGAENEFASDLRDSIWMFGRFTSLPYQGMPPNRRVQFTMADLEAIKQHIPSAKFVSAENPLGSFWNADTIIRYKKRSGNFSVFGTGEDYFNIKVYQDYHFGRRLNKFDSHESRKVATIGTRVAEALFDSGADPVGEFISINGVTFKVVGVFYDEGWEGRMSERIYIPLETFQKTFGRGKDINLITVVPDHTTTAFELEEKVLNLLKERHKIAPQDERALFSMNTAERVAKVDNLFSSISVFIWFVGIGTLMAGIVGISNIMMITVKERTQEIGIRKALGATPYSIVSLVMMESIFITSVAGYLGMVAGVGLLELTNTLLNTYAGDLKVFERPEVDFQLAIISIVILVVVGALAGLIPAIRAAQVTPTEAMREE